MRRRSSRTKHPLSGLEVCFQIATAGNCSHSKCKVSAGASSHSRRQARAGGARLISCPDPLHRGFRPPGLGTFAVVPGTPSSVILLVVQSAAGDRPIFPNKIRESLLRESHGILRDSAATRNRTWRSTTRIRFYCYSLTIFAPATVIILRRDERTFRSSGRR